MGSISSTMKKCMETDRKILNEKRCEITKGRIDIFISY